MKKLLMALVLVTALMMVPMTAGATTFTFTQAELLDMVLSWDNGGLGNLESKTATAGGVMFEGYIFDGIPQFRSIGIGFPWGSVPASAQDLSAYDSYALTFANVNNQSWMVNLYMNTGWTDGPWSEDNNFYENGWTDLAVGDSATLVIDFAALGVANLNHVTNIGFQIAFNDPTPTYQNSSEFQGDNYHMQVNPIPEPATMILLGVGLIGLAGLGRKQFMKK